MEENSKCKLNTNLNFGNMNKKTVTISIYNMFSNKLIKIFFDNLSFYKFNLQCL